LPRIVWPDETIRVEGVWLRDAPERMPRLRQGVDTRGRHRRVVGAVGVCGIGFRFRDRLTAGPCTRGIVGCDSGDTDLALAVDDRRPLHLAREHPAGFAFDARRLTEPLLQIVGGRQVATIRAGTAGAWLFVLIGRRARLHFRGTL